MSYSGEKVLINCTTNNPNSIVSLLVKRSVEVGYGVIEESEHFNATLRRSGQLFYFDADEQRNFMFKCRAQLGSRVICASRGRIIGISSTCLIIIINFFFKLLSF